MLLAIRALEDSQDSMIQRFRFVVSPLPVQDCCERGEVCRNVDMIRTKSFFPDLDSASSKGFALGITTPRMFESAQVVINRRDLRMVRAEFPFNDLQRPVVKPLG